MNVVYKRNLFDVFIYKNFTQIKRNQIVIEITKEEYN